MLRRIAGWTLALMVGVAALHASTAGAQQEDRGERIGTLTSLAIEQIGKATGLTFEVDRVEGSLLGTITLRNVKVSDKRGAVATVDTIRLSWSPTQIFNGNVRIDELLVRDVRLIRPPAKPPEQAAPLDLSFLQIQIDQPLDLRVEKLRFENVVMEEEVFGKRGAFDMTGRFILPRDRERLDLELRLQRQSGSTPEGHIIARMDPETSRLSVDVELRDEPGGLIAGTIGLPPDDPIALTVKGEAPVSDWTGKLELDAGDSGALAMDIAARTQDGTTRVTLDGRGGSSLIAEQLSGLGTQVNFRIVASYGERIAFDTLEINGTKGSINGSGWLEPQTNEFLLTLDAKLDELKALEPVVGFPLRGSGELTARMSGKVDSPTVQFGLDARDFRFDRLAARQARLTVSMTPVDGADAATARALELKLTTQDAWLDRQAGGQERLEDLGLTLTGRVDLARRTARDVKLSARVGGATLDASGDLTQLAPLKARGEIRFSGTVPPELLYGARLAEARLDGTLAVDQEAKTASVDLDGSAGELKTGIPWLDGLIAGRTTLEVEGSRNDTVVDLRQFSLRSDNLVASATGRISRSPQDELRVNARVQRLAPLQAALGTRLAGQAKLDAVVRRDGDALGVRGTLNGESITVSQVGLGTVSAEVDLRDALAAPSGDLSMRLSGGELTGRVSSRIATTARGLRISDLSARLNVGRLDGDLLVPGQGGPAEGRISLVLDRLGPLLQLAGLRGSGSLRGTVRLNERNGRQAGQAVLRGGRLDVVVGGSRYRANVLRIDARSNDVADPKAASGSLVATGLNVGGTAIDRVGLRLRTGLRGNFTASAKQTVGKKQLTVSTAGAFRGDPEDLRITVSRLSGQYAKQRFALARPLPIRVRGSTTTVGPGTLTLAGRPVGFRVTMRDGAYDGRITADKLPARLLRVAGIGRIDRGTLSGTAQIRGQGGGLAIAFDVRGDDLRRRRAPASAALDLTAKGRWTPARLQVEGRLSGQTQADALRFAATVPSRGPIDAAIKGQMNLQTLSDSGLLINYQMSGRLIADLEITGSQAAPQASGTLRVENGRFVNAQTGLVIANANFTLRGRGREITIVEAAATDGGSGRLRVDGRITMAPAQGYPMRITVTAERMRVMRTDDIRATVSGDVTVSGNTRQGLAASGRITVNEGDIIIPERLPPSVTVLDVVEINTPPGLRQDQEDEAETADVTPPIRLDLTVVVPNRLFIRGRGVTAEMEGRLRIRGTLAETRINGRLSMVRGHVDLLGRRFEFRTGTVDFTQGDLSNPRINILAEAKAAEITAIVRIAGPAKNPRFSVESEPTLPRDEVLSRIMFGKDVGALGSSDALRLAAGAATLFGPGGAGLPDRIRRAAGLDIIDIKTQEGSPRAVFGKYVSDRILVKIEQGVTEDSTAAGAEIEIIDNFSVESKVDADGNARLGIKWRYDY